MNAIVSIQRPRIDAFHKERSKCIDAFAALEEAVVRIISKSDQKHGNESFGQKLELLRKIKACPQISKKRVADLQPFIARCANISEVRNDIVHSRLQIATIGDESRACFTNTRYCMVGSQTARLFTLAGLRDLTKETSELAGLMADF